MKLAELKSQWNAAASTLFFAFKAAEKDCGSLIRQSSVHHTNMPQVAEDVFLKSAARVYKINLPLGGGEKITDDHSKVVKNWAQIEEAAKC